MQFSLLYFYCRLFYRQTESKFCCFFVFCYFGIWTFWDDWDECSVLNVGICIWERPSAKDFVYFLYILIMYIFTILLYFTDFIRKILFVRSWIRIWELLHVWNLNVSHAYLIRRTAKLTKEESGVTIFHSLFNKEHSPSYCRAFIDLRVVQVRS